jgi:hypothetical protein
MKGEKTMRKLNELDPQELENLFAVNEKLRSIASERAQENADFWVSEYLTGFRNLRGVDYNIGYPANYMTVRNTAYKDFLDAAKEAQENFGLFEEETANRIERALARVEIYDDATYGYYDMSSANFTRLEKWMDEQVETIAAELAARLETEYEYAYTDDAARDFLEFIVDEVGDKYETDGKYLYETERRKYA